MVLNLSLIIVDLWLGAGLIVLLHRISARYGLSPFFILLGLLFTMTRVGGILQPFVRATPDLVFGITGNVLVPLIVFSILLIYITLGTIPARIVILSGLGLDILFTLMLAAIRTHLALPGGLSFADLTADSPLISPALASTLASSGAFIIDLLVVVIMYQALDNLTPRVPRWLRIGGTLIVALMVNSIVFSSLNLALGISDFERFITRMPGRLVGQTISGLLLLPVAVPYIQRVAPRLPGFVGFDPRPTFDLILGTEGEIERRLRETRLELIRTTKAYETLADEISNTTHDLRNPLTTLLLRLQMLVQVDDPEQRLREVDAAKQQVRVVSDLIDNLLLLSRMSEEPLRDVHPVDMNLLAEQVVDSLQPLAAENGQTLRFKRADQPMVVEGNDLELTRALTNLSVNALNYTPRGGKIEVGAQVEDDLAVLTVHDTGFGIAPDQLDHIWARFYRGTEGVNRWGGTGLGLAIVKNVVDRHQGQVTVESEPGHGSTFVIKMKLQSSEG